MTLTIGLLIWLVGFLWGRNIFHTHYGQEQPHPNELLASAMRGAGTLFVLAGAALKAWEMFVR